MKSIESSKRMYPPLSVKDFHYISKQSGIPLTALESIYGKCPIDDEKHRVLIRLKGKNCGLGYWRCFRLELSRVTKVEGFILDKDCGIIVGGNSHSTVNREEL